MRARWFLAVALAACGGDEHGATDAPVTPGVDAPGTIVDARLPDPEDASTIPDASQAGWFVVTTTADAVDATPGDGACATIAGACSLRAAIQEANATAGADGVLVPAATYTLALAGTAEDAAATGDLDVTDDLTIHGDGEAATIVSAGGIDRVLDVRAGTLRLEALTIRDGNVMAPSPIAHGGGANVVAGARLELAFVTITASAAWSFGGGLYVEGVVDGDQVTISDCTASEGAGAGVFGNGSALTLRIADIRGNAANNGGAFYTSAGFELGDENILTLVRATVRDNTVVNGGGGLLANARTTVTIRDSTFTGNVAGGGGAIFNDGGCHIDIRGSTIYGNHAGHAGGIIEVHFDPEFIQVGNSIIAGNTSEHGGIDCDREIGSLGGLLVGNTTNCVIEPHATDLVGVAPMLGPLVELPRGAYFVPLATSPAVDAGLAANCSLRDQAGALRPRDGDGDGEARCDLGAGEL
jgi:CSLREA domain-containing protein